MPIEWNQRGPGRSPEVHQHWWECAKTNKQKANREGRAWEGAGTSRGWSIIGTKGGVYFKKEGVGEANHDESAKRSRRAKVAQRSLGTLGTAVSVAWWERRPDYTVEKWVSYKLYKPGLVKCYQRWWPLKWQAQRNITLALLTFSIPTPQLYVWADVLPHHK